jgi:hypothetical protein
MGQDDLKPEGRSVRHGGEAFDDDVEGHGSRKAVGFDPEGSGKKVAAVEPDGRGRGLGNSDDEDVEGHGHKQVGFAPDDIKKVGAVEPEGRGRASGVTEEDDVEGHRVR